MIADNELQPVTSSVADLREMSLAKRALVGREVVDGMRRILPEVQVGSPEKPIFNSSI
jgi:hypothetical protein